MSAFYSTAKKTEDIRDGEVVVVPSYSDYDDEGFRNVSYPTFKVLKKVINVGEPSKSHLVTRSRNGEIVKIYGKTIGGKNWVRVME